MEIAILQIVMHILLILILDRLIRLSSRNLNYMIGIGAMVLYTDVYLFVVPVDTRTATIAICNVHNNK